MHREGQGDRQGQEEERRQEVVRSDPDGAQGGSRKAPALRAFRPLAVTLGVLMASAACASDDQAEPAQAAARDSLRITIRDAAGDRSKTWTLRCRPTGGTWSDRSGACRRLRDAKGRKALSPIGPETRDLVEITRSPVHVTGRLGDRQVDVRIPAQGSSTRAKRFAQLRTLLGRDAFDRAARDVRDG